MFSLEAVVFSPAYRDMVRILKKMQKEDLKDEVRLDDIRTSPGSGRKGSASRPPSLPKIRQPGGNSRKKPGPADKQAEEDSYPRAALALTDEV